MTAEICRLQSFVFKLEARVLHRKTMFRRLKINVIVFKGTASLPQLAVFLPEFVVLIQEDGVLIHQDGFLIVGSQEIEGIGVSAANDKTNTNWTTAVPSLPQHSMKYRNTVDLMLLCSQHESDFNLFFIESQMSAPRQFTAIRYGLEFPAGKLHSLVDRSRTSFGVFVGVAE